MYTPEFVPGTPKVEYHPHGYPNLGLSARTLDVRYRKGASVTKLAQDLEAWEHARGNHQFKVRRLSRLHPELAFELVHVYVALREMYPQVRVDSINFCSDDIDQDTLAVASPYPRFIPLLRELVEYGYITDHTDREAVIAAGREAFSDAKSRRVLLEELDAVEDLKVGDVTTSGSIELGPTFSRKREYQKLLKYWRYRNLLAERAGTPARVMGVKTSAAAMTLVHEFGHLVESELLEKSEREVNRVYGVLSQIVLGTTRPAPTQWRYHLVNYPSSRYSPAKGKLEGSAERRKETKRALRMTIREKLGAYAHTCRDELFAEAFAAAYTHGDRQLRDEFRAFRYALTRCGLGVLRRPSR
jgi:hypothetical protein